MESLLFTHFLKCTLLQKSFLKNKRRFIGEIYMFTYQHLKREREREREREKYYTNFWLVDMALENEDMKLP